jgi:hypothetical protein
MFMLTINISWLNLRELSFKLTVKYAFNYIQLSDMHSVNFYTEINFVHCIVACMLNTRRVKQRRHLLLSYITVNTMSA